MMPESSYSQSPGGGYGYGYGADPNQQSPSSSATSQQTLLRRRQQMYDSGYGMPASPYDNNGNGVYYGGGGVVGGNNGSTTSSGSLYGSKSISPRKSVVKKLDFMFPKVDTEYTVHTDSGGVASVIAYFLIIVLSLAEIWTWSSQNGSTIEHAYIDTSMGKRMRVNVNITFPALACEDLHVDIMDIAGDSQLDVEGSDTMTKLRLNRRGYPLGDKEIIAINKHRQEQEQRKKLLETDIPADYCGPCYGADPVNETANGCCNTCDEVIEAYKKKRWRSDLLVDAAEQCIREGRDKSEMKKLRHGEGCNIAGHFSINRVGGNFHIAMGEGVERDGRHIHTFNPDDTHNFNASHVIHHLSFGPEYDYEDKNRGRKRNQKIDNDNDRLSLNGVTKVVDKSYGTTGLFQYFIKIVPTTYVGDDGKNLETNRYFFTERFRPLMKEYITDDEYFGDEHDYEDEYDDEFYTDDAAPKRTEEEKKKRQEEREERKKSRREKKIKSAQAGATGSHAHRDHHNVKNAVLPGVFFIYEIYPFAVEVSKQRVPVTHLLIRLMATIGGIFTIVKWFDSLFFARKEATTPTRHSILR